MTLGEWLEKNDVGQAEFAVRIEVTQSQVSRLVNGRRRPGRRVALAIQRETAGAISADSWDPPATSKLLSRGRRVAPRRAAARETHQNPS